MAVYAIKYQLNKPSKNYESLYAALQQYTSVRDPHLHTVWFVDTNWNTSQIFNHLAAHMDGDDRLFVTKVSSDKSGWMDKDVWAWINARL